MLLVYDITDKESFKNIPTWLEEVKKYSPENAILVLIGNKTDMEDNRKISFDNGHKYASQCGMMFIETSAKDSTNVDTIFKTIVAKLCNDNTLHESVIQRSDVYRKLSDKQEIQEFKPINCCY